MFLTLCIAKLYNMVISNFRYTVTLLPSIFEPATTDPSTDRSTQNNLKGILSHELKTSLLGNKTSFRIVWSNIPVVERFQVQHPLYASDMASGLLIAASSRPGYK